MGRSNRGGDDGRITPGRAARQAAVAADRRISRWSAMLIAVAHVRARQCRSAFWSPSCCRRWTRRVGTVGPGGDQPSRSSLPAYKLVIRHLGEHPRDDLRLAEAPKGLGLGLLLGFLVFSLVVGVAAIADVYNIVGEGGTGELSSALVAMAIVPGFMEELLFRGILFRWLEEFGGSWFALALTSALFGLGAYLQPQRDRAVVVRDRAGGRRAARRRLHADPQFVDGDRAARGVELHPGLDLRRAGVGDRPERPGRGAAVGPGAPVRRRVRARGVADRDGHRDRGRGRAGRAGGPARRAGAAVVGAAAAGARTTG